jgi:hypothetical protein
MKKLNPRCRLTDRPPSKVNTDFDLELCRLLYWNCFLRVRKTLLENMKGNDKSKDLS